MAKRAQEFKVGDRVVDTRYETNRRTGQVVGLATIGTFDGGSEPLYRIDFGRYRLHLTADEIELEISSV